MTKNPFPTAVYIPQRPKVLASPVVVDAALGVIDDMALRCPPHRWFRDVHRDSEQEFDRCLWCQAVRPCPPQRKERCTACQGQGYLRRVSYPAPCGACQGLGFIAVHLPSDKG